MFAFAKCRFKEWLYGPKNQWPEEPPKTKKKKKERVIFKAPPVMCECGVKANYDLVPSELGVGHYCSHMVDYDEVGYCCGKHEIIFFLFLNLPRFFRPLVLRTIQPLLETTLRH